MGFFDKIGRSNNGDRNKNRPQFVNEESNSVEENKTKKLFEAFLGSFSGISEYYYITYENSEYLFKCATLAEKFISSDDERLAVVKKSEDEYNKFIDILKESVRDWDKSYNDLDKNDGTQWHIEFLNRKGRYSGTNFFPDNFESVMEFIRESFGKRDSLDYVDEIKKNITSGFTKISDSILKKEESNFSLNDGVIPVDESFIKNDQNLVEENISNGFRTEDSDKFEEELTLDKIFGIFDSNDKKGEDYQNSDLEKNDNVSSDDVKNTLEFRVETGDNFTLKNDINIEGKNIDIVNDNLEKINNKESDVQSEDDGYVEVETSSEKVSEENDVNEVSSFELPKIDKDSIRIGIKNEKSNYVILISHIKDTGECDLAFGDRNNLDGKGISDISTQILESQYNSFVDRFYNIIEDWNNVYPGYSNVRWSVKVENDVDRLIRGNGGFPKNWNDFIDLLVEYEVLFKEKKIIDMQEKQNIDLNDANFIELVESKFEDLFFVDIIIKYFKEELKETDVVAKFCFKDIMKYDDILNEFTNYLVKRTYDIENPIEINGYTAKQISLLNPKFTASGVYTFMKLLRDNKTKALSIINSGFANKDAFSLGFGKDMDDLREDLAQKYIKEMEAEVDQEMINRGLLHIENGEKVPVFGSCNTRWEIEKRLLKERYNIDWKTPAEKNPFIKYD